MKEKTKKISCYLIVILLTLLLPFTMVLAEETEKNMEEPVGSWPITTVGATEDSDDKIPTIGAESDSSDINESTPVTNPGDNPASVDENRIIVPIAIGGTILVAAIITIIVIKKKKGN